MNHTSSCFERLCDGRVRKHGEQGIQCFRLPQQRHTLFGILPVTLVGRAITLALLFRLSPEITSGSFVRTAIYGPVRAVWVQVCIQVLIAVNLLFQTVREIT